MYRDTDQMMVAASEHDGYCCKHQVPSSATRKGSLGSNMMVQRQNSYDEKEEVEAVESSV